MHGTIAMHVTRKGRKRKAGGRKPSGDLIARPVDYRSIAALNPDRRCLPISQRLSEKAGTLLGRLNLVGQISDGEYEAGTRYQRIVAQYLQMANAPRLSQMRPLVKSDIDPDAVSMSVFLVHEDRDQAITDRYMRAYEAVSESAGRSGHMAVNRVAIDNHGIFPEHVIHLRKALCGLEVFFGISRSRL